MKGYERLHPNAQTLFTKVHAFHLQSMGLEERKKYELSQIKEIAQGNNHVVVFYKNGEHFNYYPNMTWG